MADLQKTVEIIFGGVDKTGGAISSVGRNIESLSNSVGSVTGPLAGITDSILKLDVALAALGVAALAFATKEAVTFEAALIDLQKVMDESEGSATDYSDVFSDMSSKFGVSASLVIQSAANYRQAGFDIKDSLLLVEQSLLAVNAADLSTVEASELLIGTLAGFNAPASEAAHLLDVLNGVSNNAGASVSQLGEGFKVLGPVAKALGLSFEETAALLTPVVEVTRSGSESANALKTAISNLIKPTGERLDLLKDELGIQLEVDGVRRNTKDVLYDLIAATKGLDDNEKQRVATIIAGSQQMSRFLAVLNGAERSEEILKVAMESSGSAIEEFNVKTQSAEFALSQLRAAFTTTAATIGLEYIDQTKEVTKATTGLLDSFREAAQGDNADVLFEALRNGMSSFAQQVDVIAKNLPEAFEGLDFSKFLSSFGDLGDELGNAFTAVFGDIDLGTVEGLESALQRVVDAFTALVSISAGIIDGLDPLFKLIGTGITEFEDLDDATKRTVGEFLGLAKAIDTVLPALSGLGGGLSSVGNGLTAIAGASGLKTVIGQIGSLKASVKDVGKFGLIGSALLGFGVGYGIGELINKYVIEPMEEKFGGSIGTWLYDQFNADEIAKIEAVLKPLTEEEQKLAQATGELRQLNDRLAESLDNTKQSAELDTYALNRRAQELVSNANKQLALNSTMESFTGSQRTATNAVENLSGRVEKSGGALADVGKTTRELAENNKSLTIGYDQATGKVNSWTGGIIRSNSSLDAAADKTQRVLKETENFRIEMEKLSSNERVKTIEAVVSLDIAEVEANAKKVEALAASIATTFSESTQLLGGIFAIYDSSSTKTKWKLADQIKKENKIREEQLGLQKKLTEAEVDYIKQKTQNLKRGDALIKVDGTGLQPHLEAFMFEILNEIQVRVNADGEEMLLGLK